MNVSAVEYGDVQGLVRFGYASLTEACFFLLKIRDSSAARSWLQAAPVSTALELKQAPSTALQVAFTHEGLRALDVPEQVLAGFSAEFLSGMSGDESRSRRLGDIGPASPENWQWGSFGRVPHLLVMLYAQPGGLQALKQAIQTPTWATAFEVLDCLPTSNLYGVEPFGFTDGISQPELDWNQRREVRGDQLDYANLVCLGEFVLGYRNEYGKYTDRPLLEATDASSATLPAAEDVPEKRDLGRNGSYLVFRQLEQDLQGFWRFVDRQTNSDPVERQGLAESMVGRRTKGEPLFPPSANSIVGVDPEDAPLNQFTFDADPNGTRCPVGAHIRRANPRNADLPAGTAGLLSRLWHTLGFGLKDLRDDVIASVRFHRLLRRGREYGSGLTPEQAIQNNQPDSGAHGINFIAINANISRQFEFVQASWLMGTKFGGLTEESDPLTGNRQPISGCPFTDTFSLPQESGVRTRITGLPTFVTVRGGAYFFLPGIRALRYLATVGEKRQG
jgi:deferrochelatase/peroxidase EfeB